MKPTTKQQRKALYQLYLRQKNFDHGPYFSNYKQMRRQAWIPGYDTCVLIKIGHITYGIEKDGYTHT